MARIIHISPVFWDEWAYQENILTQDQAKAGHEIIVISSKKSISSYRKEDFKLLDYFVGDVRVIRLEFLFNFLNRFFLYRNLLKTLIKYEPQIIMVHGVQMLSLLQIIQYKKINPQCKIYGDFHADIEISGSNWISRIIIHRLIWRAVINFSFKYFEEIYYTRPSVKEFSSMMYSIDQNLLIPLYLGSDYPNVNSEIRNDIKSDFRRMLKISSDSFVLVTGGKIDEKSDLVNFIKCLSNSFFDDKLHLVIFGKVHESYSKELLKFKNDNFQIHFLNWLNRDQVYECFIASDIVFFLGRHSVLWEQAIGSGNPVILKYKENREYLDQNNNIHFIFSEHNYELIKTIRLLRMKQNYLSTLTFNSLNSVSFNFSNIVKNLNKRWGI